MRTRLKVCGFTRSEDACFAARLGVDAIGLVFYPPSPRAVDIARACEIVQGLPPFVSVVALFVDEQEDKIRDVLEAVSVDCLQFHGHETPEQCRLYHKPYMKALRMKPELDVAEMSIQYADASALLLDAYQPGLPGGSGHAFDWNRVPEHCALPIVLAGGLKVDNVQDAIRQTRPYAVDVSSGVESAKGIKDPAKMTALVEQINESNR
jgi:phosphoribosylanthranilate isomerase